MHSNINDLMDNIFSDEIAIENFLFSGKDIKYNVTLWGKTKETNILYITGYCGSGKSTLSTELYYDEKDSILWNMDEIFNGFNSSQNKKARMNQLFLEDIISKVPGYKKIMDNKLPDFSDLLEKNTIIVNILKYLNDTAEKLFGKYKFIIEGYQLYDSIPSSFIANKPLIIKGTSGLKSGIRAAKRNTKEYNTDYFTNLQDFISFAWDDSFALKNLKHKQDRLQHLSSFR